MIAIPNRVAREHIVTATGSVAATTPLSVAVRAAGVDLGPGEVIRGERVALDGWALAAEGPISLALDVSLDTELRLEGRVLDVIRTLNELRKSTGLELTDRIRVTLPGADAELLGRADQIREEVLAVSLEADPAATEPRIERA